MPAPALAYAAFTIGGLAVVNAPRLQPAAERLTPHLIGAGAAVLTYVRLKKLQNVEDTFPENKPCDGTGAACASTIDNTPTGGTTTLPETGGGGGEGTAKPKDETAKPHTADPFKIDPIQPTKNQPGPGGGGGGGGGTGGGGGSGGTGGGSGGSGGGSGFDKTPRPDELLKQLEKGLGTKK